MLELAPGEIPVSAATSRGRLVTVWRDAAGVAFASAHAVQDGYRLTWPGLGHFQFSPPNTRILFHAFPGVPLPAARLEFERTVQPLLLPAYGVQALHASAAATPDGVVVFTGLAGSGKSTLAFALGLEPGCRHVADDAVAFTVTDGESRVLELPCTPQLRPNSAAHFSTAALVEASASPRPLPIGLVVLLQQADCREPQILDVPRAEAFSRIVTHAHAFDAEARAERERLVADYLALVATVPVSLLRYPPRFDQLPGLLRLIRHKAAGAALA